MNNKRTEFKLRFTQDNGFDYAMILRTTEPHTEEEIRYLIDHQIERFCETAPDEDYSPVDIMDSLTEEKGWEWEDLDYQEMEIENWKREDLE